ncbi:MAG: flagellin [Ignavibacteria bacterium]|jgi:flagellin|nr:flagellin [Ignavibacteria bacterium]
MATAIYSGARVRTNIPAENAYNALTAAGQKIATGQLRLSTGKRINSAADDVAGYITSKSLSARNGSLKAAKQAAGDAKNVTAIAQDSLEQINDLMTQIKDATAQASAGALGTDEKISLAKGAFRLAQQIQFITDSTVFGGQQLLQGNYSGNWVTGYSAVNDLMTIGIDLDFKEAGAKNGGSFGTAGGTGSASKNDSLYNIQTGDEAYFDLNATHDQLYTNLDVTDPTANANGLDNNPDAIVNGQASPGGPSYSYGKFGSTGLGTGHFAGITGLNLGDLDLVSTENLGIFSSDRVQTTMKSITEAINNVNKVATYLGGIQVRLTSQEETLTSQITNYKAAISRIEDADVAAEQMGLIQAQFLQSASLTSLAQANQNPSEFLQLLR